VSEQHPGLRRGRLWMMRISVFCSRRWVAKLCRLFRARNKRHNSEHRIIPSGRLEARRIRTVSGRVFNIIRGSSGKGEDCRQVRGGPAAPSVAA
jgi:hypothetical protein